MVSESRLTVAGRTKTDGISNSTSKTKDENGLGYLPIWAGNACRSADCLGVAAQWRVADNGEDEHHLVVL